MKKWIASAIILAIVVFGSVIGFNMFKAQKIKEYLASRPIPVFSVTATTAQLEDWTPHLRAIGFIEPIQGVTIANEVAGKVAKINFTSGQQMKKDEPILYLDSEVEKANLKTAKARLPAIERNYKRLNSLLKKGSISQGDVDDAEAEFLALQGEIEGYEATISLRTIRAPFSGIAGLRNVFLGQYLASGSDIVQLEDISRMQMRFTVAQNDLNKLHIGQAMNIFIDAQPDTAFTGKISAIEPAVNSQSGLVQVQASIPNDQQILRSGMFAKANVILPTLEAQIVIPVTAVNYTLYGETVYVITEKEADDGSSYLEVKQQIVTLGKTKEDKIHVLSGIKAGDRIVTSGQIRLSNGSHVNVVESDALDTPSVLPAL
ncbi:efflux RND transporter periplasmic adaptor subunit [Psychromonas sp. 14N.309.X.WAT.B.A12]|jgi:membrane fusion protein, multidrug efflux system|uniref:efflux RND transporter periplasmic adaptor subunit n=1 Tax=unclassified Psychromonas TaxID=2614957 RepID=UPI0025B26DB6|nr:efflux RND transporter periplasmic adaptor subunit [Psychromonas sp. 14N.309.X.WAT.B.A12]MDN2664009.1 efflux RND transporter periplasmic adaptor subunit [Psychromonas sp. 14N.309.X.WAT.B.A12]